MFNYDKFNARLDELGIKKAHIARKIGRNPTYIQDHQNYNYDFSPEETRIIANCLFTSVAYLTDQTDVKEKPIREDADELDLTILAFLHSLPVERVRGLLLALEAPSDVLAALDRAEWKG